MEIFKLKFKLCLRVTKISPQAATGAVESDTRDLEGRKMRIAVIYACVLLYFLLKVAAVGVPS